MKNNKSSIVMMGATGAVGTQVVRVLLQKKLTNKLTLLGRRPLLDLGENTEAIVVQHSIDIFQPSSYEEVVGSHEIAICTLGVGEPSKVSKEDFVKIDKQAVIDFAIACKNAGVRHFQLLSSVGSNTKSASFFLRTKGELIEELKALNFKRLSIFQPSMILTPRNRYGFTQALTLFFWPLLKPILIGPLRQFRGINVNILGKSFALNTVSSGVGVEFLTWDDFIALSR